MAVDTQYTLARLNVPIENEITEMEQQQKRDMIELAN